MRNYFNELYAKDSSKKVRVVKRAQAERGELLGGRPPYGYRRDETVRKGIVPDEEAAAVVKRIFSLCAAGKGPNQIAGILTKEQILNPTNYYYQKHGASHKYLDTTSPCRWSSSSVTGILDNKTYLGHMAGLRSTTMSYKNKKLVRHPESEQLLVENVHEPLIAQQQWDIVQDVRKHKKRTPKQMEEPNMFSGLVYCADCKKTMVLHRAHTMKASYNNFKCYTYNKRGKDVCSAHYLKEQDLVKIVLDDLRRVTHFARQKELNAAIPVKETRLEKLKASAANVEAFIEKAKRYTDIPELTPELLRLFIERIEIGERSERYSRTAEQDIRIVYRDVGVMDSVEPVESDEQEIEELTEQAEIEELTEQAESGQKTA